MEWGRHKGSRKEILALKVGKTIVHLQLLVALEKTVEKLHFLVHPEMTKERLLKILNLRASRSDLLSRK